MNLSAAAQRERYTALSVVMASGTLAPRWGEIIVAALCAPALLGGTAAVASAVAQAVDVTIDHQLFAGLLMTSPMLLLVGAVTLALASLGFLWLPGRRRVKLPLLAAGCVAWVAGFLVVAQFGLLSLP